MIVHVVAFQHKVPGEGVGGFDWRMTADEVDAIERERVATGFYGPEYEHAIFPVEIPDDVVGNDAITAYLDGCYIDELHDALHLGESFLDKLRRESGYDPEGEGSVDYLIAYKDALEAIVGALDAPTLNRIRGGETLALSAEVTTSELDGAPIVQIDGPGDEHLGPGGEPRIRVYLNDATIFDGTTTTEGQR